MLVVGFGFISVKTLSGHGYVTVNYDKMETDFKVCEENTDNAAFSNTGFLSPGF